MRQAFGPYHLLERISVGGTGEVFRAVAQATGHVVALKRLMPAVCSDVEVVETLLGEARLARTLDHPTIAKVLDAGEVEGIHFTVYEFVHGRDLRQIQQRALREASPPSSRGRSRGLKGGEVPPGSQPNGDQPPGSDRGAPSSAPRPVPLDVSMAIVMAICEALAHAHGRRDGRGTSLGIVHRDVSPSNILVSFEGEVKLADFGIARAVGRASHTAAGVVKGTVGYMSPEQVAGHKADPRSDIYALGVCLYELAIGGRLFEGSHPLAVMQRIASGDLPPPRSHNPALSVELEAIILKALAQSPDRRYPTAAEFHGDLSALAHAEGRLASPTRVAQYVRSLFPEVAAESAASREESPIMADDKGGSDLDVFEGLAKKSQRAPGIGLTPPPASQPRQRTLVGGLGPLPTPLPPPPAPPTPGSSSTPLPGGPPAGALAGPGSGPASSPPLPPPSMPRPRIDSPLPGSLPPPSGRMSQPGSQAPASQGASALTTPLPPPPPSRAPKSLPPVSAPPQRLSTPAPVGNPLPPPTITPMPLSGPPPSSPAGGPRSGAPPASLPPPNRPSGAPSIGSTLGFKDGKAEAKKASVEMDWDDEEESTHVYDKTTHEMVPKAQGPRPAAGTPAPTRVGAAAALLASSGTAAAPVPANAFANNPANAGPAQPYPAPSMQPMHPSSPPPGMIPHQPVPAMSRHDEHTAVRSRSDRGGSSSKVGIILGALSLLAVIGLAVFMLFPRTGDFKIDIKAKDGSSIDRAEIFVDGQKKCDTAPCVVRDLSPGSKTIKVIAPGIAASDAVTETIEGGKEKMVVITIDASANLSGASAGASAGSGEKITGIRAQSAMPGVKVFVDGDEKGTLPTELKLTPGSHKIRFEAGDRYQKSEQTVDVVAGEAKDLGIIKLKVLKGHVTLDLATTGASVMLVGTGAKKVEKRLPDALWKSPPVKLDIDASERWRLVATKKGFEEFSQDLSFEDGQAERTIRIELTEVGKPKPAPVAAGPITPAPGPAAPAPAPAKTGDPEPAATAAPAAAGNGTLNINSIPVSKVLLDGRPMGSTPKVGVSVPAGSHTVTFVHPDKGRKTVSVNVKAGETKTAAVKF